VQAIYHEFTEKKPLERLKNPWRVSGVYYVYNMFPGETYHIYNHANGWENLFVEDENYRFFLGKMNQYILPVSKLFAYCLMPNHFHLMAGMRSKQELVNCLSQNELDKFWNLQGFEQQIFLEKKLSKSFSNLFNSYTQSFNKVYNRRGSLFTPNMKKKPIFNEGSFCKVVQYIHANPVHHMFAHDMKDWEYSSYNSFFKEEETIVDKNHVLGVFGGLDAFRLYHQQPVDLKKHLLE
jgi:REP element-mobilizing transposase RayT